MPDDDDKKRFAVSLFYRSESRGQVYEHMREFRFRTAQEARDHRLRLLSTKAAWLPHGCYDEEVSEIAGPGLVHERMTRDQVKVRVEELRHELANAKGPLARGLANVVDEAF